MKSWRGPIAAGVLLLAVAACVRDEPEPRLLNVTAAGDGPDEFSILPTRPLEMPFGFAELPMPTPGGANRTDPDPGADVIAALGGDIGRARDDNGALVGYAARFGMDASIRKTLAVEDLDYRRQNDGRLLERLFAVNIYHRVYAPFSLDQYGALERMRRAGIRTPAVPPEPTE